MENKPTPYMEANAILHAQEGDVQAVLDVLKQMYHEEIDELRMAAVVLNRLCESALLYRLGKD